MFLLSSNSGISLLNVSVTLSTKITRNVTRIWNVNRIGLCVEIKLYF